MQFDASDNELLGRFRYHVAGLIKALILARSCAEADFLSDTLRNFWWKASDGDLVPNIGHRTALSVLKDARGILKRYQTAYEGYMDSYPLKPSETELAVEELRNQVASFTDEAAVNLTIRQLQEGKTVEWERLAKWDCLEQIRQNLDRLPRPAGNNKPDGPFPPTGFRYKGREGRDCRPLPWRLIDYLWSQRDRSASFNELAEPVWGDKGRLIDPNMLGSARREANKFFRKHGFPFIIKKARNQYLASLVDREPEKRVGSGKRL